MRTVYGKVKNNWAAVWPTGSENQQGPKEDIHELQTEWGPY
jgi:hypothetical protein